MALLRNGSDPPERQMHTHLQLPKIAIDSVFARGGEGFGTVD
jgi:hypothetical protein